MKQGWEEKNLGEVCVVERGSSPRPIQKYQTDNEDGVNWIKIGDTKGVDKYITKTKEKITKEGAEKSRYVKEGDFILSNSMSFGKPYIMKTDGYIHDGWFVFRLPDYIDKDYFYHLLTSPKVQEQIQSLGSGAIVKNISGDLVKKVNVSYPISIKEQQRIVSILDTAFKVIDKAKANAEQNLKNSKELFESYLQNIFSTKGEGWEESSINELCDEIFAGGDAPKNNFSLEETKEYTIPIYANSVKRKGLYGYSNISRVKKPSITIAARGSGTGHTEIRYNEYLPIVRLIVLIPKTSKISLEFLKHALDTLIIDKSGSAIPQLTVPMIKEYKIAYPLLETQIEIIQKLDTLSKETKRLEAIYQQKLIDLEELKKSLLEKAFKGELKTEKILQD